MKKKKTHKTEQEKQDAFDKLIEKNKTKIQEQVREMERRGQGETADFPINSTLVDDDDENVSEAEANAMVERAEKRKEDSKRKVEESVDSQEWTRDEPVIPEDLKGRVWIAVFRCPEGHKTKATNRQAESGVRCCTCKAKAEIMPQFLNKPEPPADDLEKRKQAAKGKA